MSINWAQNISINDCYDLAVGQRIIARQTVRGLFRLGEIGIVIGISTHGTDPRATMLTIIWESGSVSRQLVSLLIDKLCVTRFVDETLRQYIIRSGAKIEDDYRNGKFRF